jgi:hypothetical protein
MKPHKTHREVLKQDGIEYEIDIEEDAGGFWGSWKCLDCRQSGPSTGKCLSHDECRNAVLRNLGPHHQVMHGLHRKL